MMQRYITTDLFFMTTTSATVDSPCGGRRLHPEGAGPLHFQGITLVTPRGVWLVIPPRGGEVSALPKISFLRSSNPNRRPSFPLLLRGLPKFLSNRSYRTASQIRLS